MPMTREEVFEKLEERGAAGACVEFSGGNDEGAVDRIVLLDAGEEKIGELFESYPSYVHDEDGNVVYEQIPGTDYRRPKTAPVSAEQWADDELAEALAAPVHEEYGGFAGNFGVSGAVYWEVATGKVTISGDESAYVPFEKEL